MANKKQTIFPMPLRPLFKELCNHQKEYKSGERKNFSWGSCSECMLRDVKWEVPKTDRIIRDLCFAIWHEGILER